MPQEVRDYGISVMEASEKTKELIEKTREAITGLSFSELQSELENLVSMADLTFEDIADSFEKHMSKSILHMVKSKYINQELEKWYDKLEQAGSDGVMTEYETEELRRMYENIVKRGNEIYENAVNAAGIDLTKDNKEDPSTALSGSYKTVSEETASMVGGQMNAIRINQMEATAMIRQQLFHLANIDRNTGAIDANTRFNRYIKDIYDKMSSGDTLRSHGLS